LAGRYPGDYYGHSVAIGLAPLRRSHVHHCHTYLARFRRPVRLLECPDRASLQHPGGFPQVYDHPAEGVGAGFGRLSGGCRDGTFWRLGFRQSSFRRVARISQRVVPDAWTRPPVSWHAVFPGVLSDYELAIRSKDTSSGLCPLDGRYSSAPRGALTASKEPGAAHLLVADLAGPGGHLACPGGASGGALGLAPHRQIGATRQVCMPGFKI
jgi:hypothetical protein